MSIDFAVDWKWGYKTLRPHSSLGDLTPNELFKPPSTIKYYLNVS